jgi:hypothetical protein
MGEEMTVKECPRCGGRDGAHYVACVLQNAIQRWLGDDYPLYPPSLDRAVEDSQWAEIEQLQGQVGKMQTDLEETVQAVVLAMGQTEDLRKDLDSALDAITKPVRAETSPPQAAARENREETTTPTEPEKRMPAGAAAMQRANATVGAEAAGVIQRVIEDATAPDPNGWFPAPELLRLATALDPTITARKVGMAMNHLGYKEKRQFEYPSGSGVRPMHYRGMTWKGEPASEPSLELQMVQRRAAEKAAKEKIPEVVVGEKYRYTGEKPGPEIPPEYQRMLEPLWSIPGWSYARRNPNGGGKPRVTAPSGAKYVLSNTPSDVRGIRNAKAALRRLGAPI